MLNLLLPSAQGTVCSHRHYLNRSAVEQDSKKDDETALRVIALVGGQKTEMRHLKSSVAADQPFRLTWNFRFLLQLHSFLSYKHLVDWLGGGVKEYSVGFYTLHQIPVTTMAALWSRKS